MNGRLKSCPFCGKSKSLSIKADSESFWVFCNNCGSWGLPKKTMRETIHTWNKKKGD